jgi:uncharacterized protein YndB with AHSA1/START domain
MSELSVERSIWIDAPRERIWNALTDPTDFGKWFLPPALGAEIKRDAADKLYVSMFGMEVPVATLEHIHAPDQLTARSLPDGLLPTTFTLTPENKGTRVAVKMTGFEALSQESRPGRMAPSGAGWEKALENLQAHVLGQTLPFPQGYVAALFGFRKETAAVFAIERSIWIDAPRERVWDALTDPVKLQKWFSPTTAWRITSLTVGGRLYSPDPETGAELYTQVYDVIDPPHQLITHSVPVPPNTVDVTTYTLESEKGGTRLFLTHAGYELMPEDVRSTNLERNAFGFGMMLENIKASVEETPLPYPQGF